MHAFEPGEAEALFRAGGRGCASARGRGGSLAMLQCLKRQAPSVLPAFARGGYPRARLPYARVLSRQWSGALSLFAVILGASNVEPPESGRILLFPGGRSMRHSHHGHL